MTRAAAIGGIACAIVAAAGAAARADALEAHGADGASQLVEVRHDVDVEIADRVARFRVTRRIANRGRGVVRAQLQIDLPTRAVADGLQLRSAGRWVAGRLLPADAAADAWERLTTTGAQMAHGPALLEWSTGGGALTLSLYPVPAGGHVDVGYALEAPVCYARGRWITDYPRGGEDLAPIALRVRGPRGPGRVLSRRQLDAELGVDAADACEGDVAPGDASAVRYLVVDAPVPAPAEVRFARAAGGGADLAQLSIDVAGVIQPAPKGARVVFVVDASRSLGADGIAAELAWVRGYLAHVPDAAFEVVLYRRRPDRLFGRFEPARRAAALLDAIEPGRLVPGNGSNLDDGLRAAAALLAGTSRPARVVAFTDERWRPGFGAPDAEAALGALDPAAVLHVVGLTASTSTPSLARADDDVLAPVAARWGGMMIEAQGDAAQPAAAFAAAALELVRPIRIDQVRVVGAAGTAIGGDDLALGALAEGEGVYRSWSVTDAPQAIEGLIWGRRWRRTLVSSPAATRRWAGLAIADPVGNGLPAEAVLALATMGGVVSRETSLLALDPRWGAARLPDGWTDWATCDCIGSTIGGIGHMGTITTATDTGIGVISPRNAILAALLAPRARACAAQTRQRAWHLVVALDTTGAEIVDVHVRVGVPDDPAALDPAGPAAVDPAGPAALDPAGQDGLRACVEDAAWDLQLDDRFAAWTGHYEATVAGAR